MPVYSLRPLTLYEPDLIEECSPLIPDQRGHLLPDRFRESILPVNHRYGKCNASQWRRNLERFLNLAIPCPVLVATSDLQHLKHILLVLKCVYYKHPLPKKVRPFFPQSTPSSSSSSHASWAIYIRTVFFLPCLGSFRPWSGGWSRTSCASTCVTSSSTTARLCVGFTSPTSPTRPTRSRRTSGCCKLGIMGTVTTPGLGS